MNNKQVTNLELIANGGYNWNEEFQKLVQMEDTVEKFSKLRDLARDFTHAAESSARIIISERFDLVFEITYIQDISSISTRLSNLPKVLEVLPVARRFFFVSSQFYASVHMERNFI